jgi:hypothetical protein
LGKGEVGRHATVAVLQATTAITVVTVVTVLQFCFLCVGGTGALTAGWRRSGV